MRALIKMLFRTLRLVLMPFMLLWAKLAMPKGLVRNVASQQRVERECAKMSLYHFKTCPFCIKVRHEMGRLSLPVELRDAQHDAVHKEALLQGGGKVQTPCLRITGDDGQVQWMYESGDIIQYLQQRFA
ncbi:MAG: glutathione S-transferase N-terminal domain-containing protein [Gammaproteobacteria bacterium]|nr:glutathione S-transferase N-terminal domain-containing protein [Gammaproteobacteria bacterium]MBU1447835.1 glutathione S-transferase N-terminal domain-containing protein [Gammaproteobacteria bacterium]